MSKDTGVPTDAAFDERIGWEDSDYLCIDSYENILDKQGYEKHFGGKYDCPQCIGMFATKWTD